MEMDAINRILDPQNPRVAGHGDVTEKNKCQKWDLRTRKPPSKNFWSQNRNFQASGGLAPYSVPVP